MQLKNVEKLLNKKPSISGSQPSEIKVLKLPYELQVHQIELEMQNEELRLAYERDAELAKDKYIALTHFAQTGEKAKARRLDVLNVFRNRYKKKKYCC